MKDWQPPALHAPLGMQEPLLVTTSAHPEQDLLDRAHLLAARFGVPFVPRRRSVSRMCREYGAELVYVVRRDREEVMGADHSLFVHPGMFSLKRKDGLSHPLLRALHPEGDPPLDTVVDATLGLGGDTFHLAGLLAPRRVIGIEASPVLHALLEEGVARLAAERRRWSRGAASVELRGGHAAEVLAAMPDLSVDVVYMDPMFDQPTSGSGTFYLLRRLALHDPPSQAMLDQAWRVARRRVVWKLPAAALPPEHLQPPGPGWNRRVRGGAVDYCVLERETLPLDARNVTDAL